MAERSWRVQDESAERALKFVKPLLSDLHPRDFSVELSDGTRWPAEKSCFPRFTWKIKPSWMTLSAVPQSVSVDFSVK